MDETNRGRAAVAGESGSLREVARRSRPLLLLGALVVQLVASPLITSEWVRMLVSSAIVVAAASLAADTRSGRRVTAALLVPSLALFAAGTATGRTAFDWAAYACVLALYVHVIRLMLGRIFSAPRVTIDEIGLALSTYVLLGLLWELFYVPLAAVRPDAFAFAVPPAPGSLPQTMAYFSFVTLTTLGYGDIAPVSPLARGLAVTEALTGGLFLAVLISRLVGRLGAGRD